MKVKYTDRLTQWGEGFPLVQQGTKRLEEVLGPSSPNVSAEWDRIDEKGRDLITLRLKDESIGEVVGQFDLDDLHSTAMTAFRLHRLWGDLLQIRSQKQFEELTGVES